jgi:hypothetical protein
MQKVWLLKNENSNEVGLINLTDALINSGITYYNFNNENFIKPVVFDGQIIEGATEDELAEMEKQKASEYRTKIYELTDKLKSSAKARALGKVSEKLTEKQLNDLEESYTQKKDVALEYLTTGEVSNKIIFELIVFEEINDFAGEKLIQTIQYLNTVYNTEIPTENLSKIQMYCYIIVAKFELGMHVKRILYDLCEVFRSKLITDLDSLNFDKIDAKIALVQTITNDTDLDGIMEIKTQFDAL